MKPHVILAATEPRCRPFYQPCDKQSVCARNLAAPIAGQPVADYSSTSRTLITAMICPHFLSVARAAELAKIKPVKPWPSVKP